MQPSVVRGVRLQRPSRGRSAGIPRDDRAGADAVAARKERARRLEAIGVATPRVGGHDPLGEYRRQAQQLIVRYGAGADLARMDWMIAIDMATSGRFTQQDIERGIVRGTPNVQSRKAVHVEDYARRTAQKAWGAPEVARQRQERQRRTCSRGTQSCHPDN